MDWSKVKPLEIDEYLGKGKNRIALVSVELEGAWTKLPVGVDQLERDGSVFGGRMPPEAKHLGELAVGPAMPAAIPTLIRNNHPQKVNHTCGMHVHMSFDTLWYYQLLMIPEYQETVVKHLYQWAKDAGLKDDHCIWDRLAGKSKYCQREFWPDVQAGTKQKGHDMSRPGHRYTIIHYCGRYMTIECRVLPMMTKPVLAISAVQKLLDVTNACIYALAKKKPREKITGSVTLPNNMVYEETIMEQV